MSYLWLRSSSYLISQVCNEICMPLCTHVWHIVSIFENIDTLHRLHYYCLWWWSECGRKPSMTLTNVLCYLIPTPREWVLQTLSLPMFQWHYLSYITINVEIIWKCHFQRMCFSQRRRFRLQKPEWTSTQKYAYGYRLLVRHKTRNLWYYVTTRHFWSVGVQFIRCSPRQTNKREQLNRVFLQACFIKYCFNKAW